MKMEKKKSLAARTIGVGKGRIIFNKNNLSQIKEAITKQDIKDLVGSGAIIIKPIKGRLANEKTKKRRRAGSVKKKVHNSKREYVLITRKMRNYLFLLRKKGLLSEKIYSQLRKEIKRREIKNLSHLKEKIKSMGEK